MASGAPESARRVAQVSWGKQRGDESASLFGETLQNAVSRSSGERQVENHASVCTPIVATRQTLRSASESGCVVVSATAQRVEVERKAGRRGRLHLLPRASRRRVRGYAAMRSSTACSIRLTERRAHWGT